MFGSHVVLTYSLWLCSSPNATAEASLHVDLHGDEGAQVQAATGEGPCGDSETRKDFDSACAHRS